MPYVTVGGSSISSPLKAFGKTLSMSVFYICLTSVTRAKPKDKNEICRSISTHAVKCDGVFFVLQQGFQYSFQHA